MRLYLPFFFLLMFKFFFHLPFESISVTSLLPTDSNESNKIVNGSAPCSEPQLIYILEPANHFNRFPIKFHSPIARNKSCFSIILSIKLKSDFFRRLWLEMKFSLSLSYSLSISEFFVHIAKWYVKVRCWFYCALIKLKQKRFSSVLQFEMWFSEQA